MPAQIPQQLPELLLLRRAQGIAHGRGPRSTTAASAHNPVSGLSHFRIFRRVHGRLLQEESVCDDRAY
jgi:hypothetical protein